ncbi:hypothetical protein [Aquella oligotrophica]|nr:hypothetical protein [Aquella oligotrophica]
MKKLFSIFIIALLASACANMNGSYNKDNSDSNQSNSPLTSSRAASSN